MQNISITNANNKEQSQLLKKYNQISAERELMPPIHNASFFCAGPAGFLPRLGDYYKDELENVFFLTSKDDDRTAFFINDKYKKISSEVFIDYWKNPSTFDQRLKKIYEFEKKIAKLYLKMNYNYINSTDINTALAETEKIVLWSRHLNMLSWFYFIDIDFFNELLPIVKSNITANRLEKLWETASNPITDSFEKRRHIDYLNNIIKENNYELVVEYMQYGYATYNEIKSLKEVEQELISEYGKPNKEQAELELIKLSNNKEGRKNKYTTWLNQLDKEKQKFVSYVQKVIEIRDRRKEFISKAIVIQYRVCERLFREAGLLKDLIMNYTFEEMILGPEYLKSNIDKIKKRPNGSAMLLNYDGQIEFEYDTVDEIHLILGQRFREQEKVGESNDKIKGQIGSPGNIEGIVKIVLDPKKSKHFNDGDILVAGMTRPEFVPLMKKASAIITDEGGITCHAAIVSRELGIPCIIGTKIATQVLKDDMIVKVDANKGVVSIITR